MSAGLLHERLSSPPSAPVVIDVRSSSEYAGGHLPGAVHIPWYSLAFRLDDIPGSGKDRPLVVYCAHGPRAGLSGFVLRLAGFSSVHYLEGSMPAWRKSGLPLEEGP